MLKNFTFIILTLCPLWISFPAKATGFTDLATCFLARKGDNGILQNLGKCEMQFYSSSGGGTLLRLSMLGGNKIYSKCPGLSINYGLSGCVVNNLPGEIRVVGNDNYPAFCAWRHKDSFAYCASPWNHKGI